MMQDSLVPDVAYGVTLVFHPDLDWFSRIRTWFAQFDGFVIVDNGSDANFKEKLSEFMKFHATVQYICNGKNLGVPAGYNIGVRAAILRGAAFVTIVDQDSVLPHNYRELMYRGFCELSSAGQRIGAVAPRYTDFNSGNSPKVTLLRWGWFERVDARNERIDYPEVSLPLASGTMYHVDIFRVNGFFDEDYFVDHFETDFNLRLRQKQLKLFLVPKCVMTHSLGERKPVRILGLVFHPMGHTPLRRYYFYRNKCYLIARYGVRMPSLIVFEVLASVLDITRVLLCEDQKSKKISMVMRGIIGFFRGETGKAAMTESGVGA